jgi:2-phospho-L-lactate guanylyltransferase
MASVVTTLHPFLYSEGREPIARTRLGLVRAIVLPVKSLDEAKSRLSPMLSPPERAALTLAMLEDVLDATLALPGWASWVISPDEAVLEVAARRGAHPMLEEKPPLSSALHQAEEEAIARGMQALAVLLPDTALLTSVALTRCLHTLGPVVVAPAMDEIGTNLLLRRPVRTIPSRFGPDSYRRHLQEAAEARVPVAIVEVRELGFDLDTPNDILTVLGSRRAGRTRNVLRELDASARFGEPPSTRDRGARGA